jgi:hypothetical protein
MYPTKPGLAAGAQRPRWRQLRRPLAMAISVSLLGATAVTTAASAADDGPGTSSRIVREEARAQDTPLIRGEAPVEAVAEDGTAFTGTFRVERFRQRRGQLFAVGQLEGLLGDRSVSRHVSLPVKPPSGEPVAGLMQPHGFAAPAAALQTCEILTLVLGPLDLNLLGLHIFLDEVNLLLEAIPGAGNLVGNLLCAIAGLLDGGLLGGALTNLLNAITDLLNALLGV